MRIGGSLLIFASIGSIWGSGVELGALPALSFDKYDANVVINQAFTIPPRKPAEPEDQCPPCFNCNLAAFECKQFSSCNPFTGACECLEGFGGQDCSEPVCGGLSDGSNRKVRDGDVCECAEGWGGINCNLCLTDSVCDAFMPEGIAGTCFQQGIIVKNFHQLCDVTNKNIMEILKPKIPQATFTCNKTAGECDFQFWIAEKESFYCDLTECAFEYDVAANTTHYNCEHIQCKCLPDRMLCGESGSVDISDFLTEEIRGPGDFSCDVETKECRFSEPQMNDLISAVFGDPYITLKCESGECLHLSELPGYVAPLRPAMSLNGLLAIVGVVIGTLGAFFWAVTAIKRSPLFASTAVSLDDADDGDDSLLKDFTPAVLAFQNVSYTLNDRKILKNAFGYVQPGECLAIMGGSGAGKTTLLDILANKNKSGQTSANLYVNGNVVSPHDFKKIIGFVDQEDNLLPTLTVYETVLNSALLRLPRTMSTNAKKLRVLEVLNELRILPIKDRIIGSDFERGISGGEKRRVAIACELVTSPSILFLDEPTSGLDSYNARNVVETLVRLSRDYHRTIIFTIHQPRSNIVALFDKLLLLSEGQLVYSGDMIKCNDFFAKYGYPCPSGYNIADYLIDITAEKTASELNSEVASQIAQEHEDLHREFARANTTTSQIDTQREWAHLAAHRDEYNEQEARVQVDTATTLNLNNIYVESSMALEIMNDIEQIKAAPTPIVFKKGTRATFLDQFLILSSRTFKNTYRNPRLLQYHYILTTLTGLFCGYIYYDVKNDISGFQNRLGMFFFILTLFGFSTLTGLHSFSIERIIFIRERANNYYHPMSYYLSKIICDVLPLRVFPPIVLICIMYPMVGLNLADNAFLKANLILVVFNLAAALEILVIGILIKEPGTSTMVGVLALLFSILFAGLFINKETFSSGIAWMQWISLFHYAYEALATNEVKSLTLQEKKYGLSIEIPGAAILSTFGFDVSALWSDVAMLGMFVAVFLVVGYVFLHRYVVEKR